MKVWPSNAISFRKWFFFNMMQNFDSRLSPRPNKFTYVHFCLNKHSIKLSEVYLLKINSGQVFMQWDFLTTRSIIQYYISVSNTGYRSYCELKHSITNWPPPGARVFFYDYLRQKILCYKEFPPYHHVFVWFILSSYILMQVCFLLIPLYLEFIHYHSIRDLTTVYVLDVSNICNRRQSMC